MHFQSTSLSRGKTIILFLKHVEIVLSIHFPLTREDDAGEHGPPVRILSIHFPLTREDTIARASSSVIPSFQSTSLSRGKTFRQNILFPPRLLSIHFPLTREDCGELKTKNMIESFNPLPSHEGRRYFHLLSTSCHTPFNPLPSHEGRRFRSFRQRSVKALSIHFPLTREDFQHLRIFDFRKLSIHFPLTREDEDILRSRTSFKLSIHFPLTREDNTVLSAFRPLNPFNPLPSHEGRRILNIML